MVTRDSLLILSFNSVFSRDRKVGKLYLIFLVSSILQGPAPSQMGPVGETHKEVLNLGTQVSSGHWTITSYLSKGLSGVTLQSALRWLRHRPTGFPSPERRK